VFDVAVTDASFASSNSKLSGSIHPGDVVIVGVVTPQPFFIVSEGLIIPTNSFSGSTDVSTIQPGQTVAISVSGFIPTDGSSAFASATANGVALRFSRVTGTIVSPTSPQFSATSFQPYFGFTTNPLVQITSTGPGATTDSPAVEPVFREESWQGSGPTLQVWHGAIFFSVVAKPSFPKRVGPYAIIWHCRFAVGDDVFDVLARP
jgi:hypothetical protein